MRARPEILAAYLYGSHAKGRAGTQSDVDIAVLLEERRGRVATTLAPTYEADLANALGAALRRSPVEVVVLNISPPLLAREVLRGGRFFARAPRMVARYEYRLRQRFLDTAHLRIIQDHYLDGIIRRGFSKAVTR